MQTLAKYRLPRPNSHYGGENIGRVPAWLPHKLRLNRLEHYKRFQKAKQAKQKEVTKAVKDAITPASKDKKKSPKDDSSQTSIESKAYEKKLARQKERDAAWSSDGQWRRDILCGRRKEKPEASTAEQQEGNVNGHDAEAGSVPKESLNEPEASN